MLITTSQTEKIPTIVKCCMQHKLGVVRFKTPEDQRRSSSSLEIPFVQVEKEPTPSLYKDLNLLSKVVWNVMKYHDIW